MSETTQFGQPPFTACELSRSRINYLPPGGIIEIGKTSFEEIAGNFAERLKKEGAPEQIQDILGVSPKQYVDIRPEIFEKYAKIAIGGPGTTTTGIEDIPLGAYSAEVLPTLHLYPLLTEVWGDSRALSPKLQVRSNVNFKKDIPPSEILASARKLETLEGKLLQYLGEVIPPEWKLGKTIGGATISGIGSNDPLLKEAINAGYSVSQCTFFTNWQGNQATLGEVTNDRLYNAYNLLLSLGEPNSNYPELGKTLKQLNAKQAKLMLPGRTEIPAKMLSYKDQRLNRAYINLLTEPRASRHGTDIVTKPYIDETRDFSGEKILLPTI